MHSISGCCHETKLIATIILSQIKSFCFLKMEETAMKLLVDITYLTTIIIHKLQFNSCILHSHLMTLVENL